MSEPGGPDGEGRVLGVGGLFWRSADPAALAAWYREHLGISAIGGDAPPPDGNYTWEQQAGPMVFAGFAADTDYYPADQQVMLNLRVSGLDALVARLEAAGIPAERRPEWDDPYTGRFARIHDPEGRPIELWEPPAE